MLELLSGRRSLDDEKARGIDETLVDWAKPFLCDSRGVFRIMDTRLGGQYPKKEAQAAAAVALQCLHIDSKNRPHMIDVLATLESLHTLRNFPRKPEAKFDSHKVKHSRHCRMTKTADTN